MNYNKCLDELGMRYKEALFLLKDGRYVVGYLNYECIVQERGCEWIVDTSCECDCSFSVEHEVESYIPLSKIIAIVKDLEKQIEEKK